MTIKDIDTLKALGVLVCVVKKESFEELEKNRMNVIKEDIKINHISDVKTQTKYICTRGIKIFQEEV